MSVVESSPSLAPPQGNTLLRISGAAALYRLPVYVACTVVALVITYSLGKDVTWDTLHYHIYAGFSAFNDRFAQDYFAAGPQAYLNPYPYAPFYAMLRAGLSSLEIGALLTVFHSVILWLTYELAAAVCPFADPRTRSVLGLCAVAFALVNPLLLQQIGSTYADITTAELVLGGWLLLLTVVRAPRAIPLLCAAALLGAASAFKLGNAVHALAGGVLLLMVPLPLRGRIRYGIAYALAGSAAFAIVTAPWSYRLARTFGNPLFPMFNDIFRSPDFIPQALRLVRFIPSTLGEALWRPFTMLDPTPMVHDELRAPDGRYALLLILACTLLLKWLWRYRFASASPVRAAAPVHTRALAALAAALAVDWTLWLWTSGNSRYFLPGGCAAAVLIVMLMPLLAGAQLARWIPLAVAALGLQTFHLCMNSEGLRWTALPWDGGPWLRVEIPERVAAEPALYLSMGANSNAFLAAYVSRQAGFVNFTGSYPLGATGAGGARLEALIHRYAAHLRFLASGDQLYADLKHLPNVSDVDGALARFGLRVDPGDCATISAYSSEPTDQVPAGVTRLVTCRVVPGSTEHSPQAAAQQDAELILDRVEAACPQLLQPRPPLTEYRNHRYQRVYLNTDVTAWVSRGFVKIANLISGDGPIFLGPAEDWLRAPQRVVCGRRDGHDFARALAGGSR
jgi:hypothetical protein